jgi:23S rRNA (cytidine2498-2'-O)-methyltransferase
MADPLRQRREDPCILEDSAIKTPPVGWLVRISEAFAGAEAEIIRGLGARVLKPLGRGFHLIRIEDPAALHDSDAAMFVRWNVPVHHSWPCRPRETAGFIEKAAQALARKFGDAQPQTLLVGPLDPGAANRYYRTLGSNLRGRALQLFPPACAIRDAEEQDSRAPSLFCLIGDEGLFCGLQSPLASNGFHPGGTKFIRQNTPDTISRAGAKIVEALHHLKLHCPPPTAGSHWLELGASPGGMTAELLARGHRVTAVDRAPLDKRLDRAAGLTTVLADAASFRPAAGCRYDALLSDMNGDAIEAISQVTRLSENLQPGGVVVFTLKLPGVTDITQVCALGHAVTGIAEAAGLKRIALTHLTYNRHEFTAFFER